MIPRQPKRFATYTEQLALYKKRKIAMAESDKEMIRFLSRNNYYRLSAYFLPFRHFDKATNDYTYSKGLTFKRIKRIYEFDQKLRQLLFTIIEDIEILLRTRLAYRHGGKHGACGYKEPSKYENGFDFSKFYFAVENDIKHGSKSLIAWHHKKYYNNEMPIWAAVELFSLNTLTWFYQGFKEADKIAIANQFNSDVKHLQNWFSILVDMRNRVAHFGRLYNLSFSKILLPIDSILMSERTARSLFAQLLALKWLYLDHERWDYLFVAQLAILIKEYLPDILLSHMGFSNTWEMELLWHSTT